MPDLVAAIAAAQQGTALHIVIDQLVSAEPWIANAGESVIEQISAVLRGYGATAA